MKFIALVLAAVSMIGSVAATPADTCNRDLCFRDVLGTVFASETQVARRGDCSKLLACTETPAAAIATITTTSTVEGTITITLDKSTIQPTNVPGAVSVCGSALPSGYASCGGSFSRYSSACSCGGITATTNTGAAPTVTATVIATQPAVTVFV